MSNVEMFAQLVGSFGEHLAEHQVDAEIYSVQAYAGRATSIVVHLAADDLGELAAGLLAWADTLTEVDAEAWRFRYGDNVHLCITGHLPDSTGVRVFGVVAYTETAFGDLQPDNRQYLALGVLHWWAANHGTVTP